MLDKCANPSCSAKFRHLHQGKLFRLSPTPEVEALRVGSLEFLYERFWLCEDCAKKMEIVWDGLQAKVVDLRPRSTVASDCDDDLPCERPNRFLRFAVHDIR